ncbi:Glu/Leu/Phe/Val dehydrogenase [Marinobacter lutaoensis]|jgi:leucine dehydrogenase|uniref:Amino acid dehydrogenase n=1 Tax=Marinobacter lutaoensis TaxID=135739 RepID=A0A1V2DR88_9GAMM|nr:Glu/Leu/Phe/Val dehydrogenase [Marinobacter lutaoensis]MBE01686.1 Glu/Leu/Phe/Val dehydrogenase [Marinobacter sp.]MBI44235.1 Glu/Leu/Phe/Val dehydrogenase [Oceanospirillales bacterium]NVD36134.1 Glu/Leu/Phe/Val dehydrogenase [Marinobacter lutaoensis]ONF42990.1 amino acid dehydrogenase [Marinobacter lutaoensis]|tara:strand:+ start:1018 stop:2118 length:1101 start_codon:yes stop_codon:yes gene_type:complete
MNVFSHPEFDQHEHLSFFCDAETGLKAIVAIHNTSRGPALGGCRMYPYATDEEALRDVLRLSRGMTYKSALANLDLGGGKSVIIGDPRRHKTEGLLEAMGRHLETLGGRYIAAEDSGTSVPDLKVMGRYTRHVAGIAERTGFNGLPSNGDPSPATAYGTFIGLKAAVRHKYGQDDLKGLKVAIQGVGNVGFRLARHLRDAGAELWVYDIHADNMQRAVEQLGAKPATAEDILFLPVDVVAPCALGAVLNDRSIPKLRAGIVAGAANNLLERPEHDALLKQRDILYAPDFAINAGGIIDVFHERTGGRPEQVRAHIETIGDTLTEIFNRSRRTGLPTGEIANELAEERFRKHTAGAGLAPGRLARAG